jgi:large repetitive protein
MKERTVFRLLAVVGFLCVTPGAHAQLLDHTLSVCATPAAAPPVTAPPPPMAQPGSPSGVDPGGTAPGTTSGGKLIGATPFNPAGNVFHPPSVGDLIPSSPRSDEPDVLVDLGVVLVPSHSQVTAGEAYSYSITVTNGGAVTATGTELVMTLNPPIASITQASGPGCSSTPSQVRCQVGTLAPGTSVNITVNVATSAAGTVSATAEASADQLDSDLSDNAASASTVISAVVPAQRPDLSVGTTLNPSQVTAGSTTGLAAVVGNAGGASATGVRLTLTVPSQLTIESAPNCMQNGNTAACELGVIAAGQMIERQFALRANSGTSGAFSIMTSVTLNEQDQNPGDNQSSTTGTIVPASPAGADLSLTGSFSPARFTVGQTGQLMFTYLNAGPGEATGAAAVITLPAGTTIQSASSGHGSCTPSGSQVNCQLGTLAVNVSGQVGIMVVPGQAGTFIANSTISGNQADPNTGNNQSSVTVPVDPAPPVADLQLQKTGATTATFNQVVRYTLRIVNLSSTPAENAVISDTLPENATFVTCAPVCAPPVGGVVTCKFPSVPAQSTSTSAFVDVRMPNSPASVVNRATLTADTPDPNLSNNSATLTTTVSAPAVSNCALSIAPGTYTGDGGCGAAGSSTVSCNSGSEVKLQNPALNLTCDAGGSCGSNNTVFGAPNHRCTIVNLGSGSIRVNCEELSGGNPTGNTCVQTFVKQ